MCVPKLELGNELVNEIARFDSACPTTHYFLELASAPFVSGCGFDVSDALETAADSAL